MGWQVKKFEENCLIDLPSNIFEDQKTEDLKELIQELAEDDYKNFFLNLGQISKISSKGLGFILNLYKFAFYQEISIKLYNLQPYVFQMIYQTRMNIVFDICEYNENLFNSSGKNKSSLSA